MKKLTLFPAGGLLLGVLLAWSALAPATPYTGTLATAGGADWQCTGQEWINCQELSPECVDHGVYYCVEWTTSGKGHCQPFGGNYCYAHCWWQYCPSAHDAWCL